METQWLAFAFAALMVTLAPGPDTFLVIGNALSGGVRRGLATVAGVLTMAVGRHAVGYGLPLAAGVTIYVAASDLIPEVNREPGVAMAVVVFLGVGMLFLLDSLFHLH